MSTPRSHIRMVSGYMDEAFDDPDKITARVRNLLKGVKYDTLVGTGLSGTLVVPHVARTLGKHWLIVRKPNDGTHSWHRAEGELGKRWVFLDDFVDTGATRDRVIDVVHNEAGTQRFTTRFVGTCEYHDSCDRRPRFVHSAEMMISN